MKSKAYIYFITCKDSAAASYYKIGRTRSDPLTRIRELQIGCPFKFSIAHCFSIEAETSLKIEAAIHKQLKSYMLTNEWFSFPCRNSKKELNDVLTTLDKYKVQIKAKTLTLKELLYLEKEGKK